MNALQSLGTAAVFLLSATAASLQPASANDAPGAGAVKGFYAGNFNTLACLQEDRTGMAIGVKFAFSATEISEIQGQRTFARGVFKEIRKNVRQAWNDVSVNYSLRTLQGDEAAWKHLRATVQENLTARIEKLSVRENLDILVMSDVVKVGTASNCTMV